ncbi:MAG: nitroreductase family deazaflavin-dependent oxidoreductase [Acidimicrobiales bacterium]
MADMDDFNTKIIEEFRANDGVVGPPFEGAPMVLVHHTGAKTGTQRVTPLVYQPVGDDWAIFGSKGGAPDNPDWFHNLVANPDTEIEVGAHTVPVSATVLSGDQRDEIWEKQKELMPGFAEYEKTAGDRVIPVVLLTRR